MLSLDEELICSSRAAVSWWSWLRMPNIVTNRIKYMFFNFIHPENERTSVRALPSVLK